MNLVTSAGTYVVHSTAPLGMQTCIYSDKRGRGIVWCFRGFGAGVQSMFFQSAVLAKENLVSLGQMNLTNELVQMGNWNQAESIDKNRFEVHRADSLSRVCRKKDWKRV